MDPDLISPYEYGDNVIPLLFLDLELHLLLGKLRRMLAIVGRELLVAWSRADRSRSCRLRPCIQAFSPRRRNAAQLFDDWFQCRRTHEQREPAPVHNSREALFLEGRHVGQERRVRSSAATRSRESPAAGIAPGRAKRLRNTLVPGRRAARRFLPCRPCRGSPSSRTSRRPSNARATAAGVCRGRARRS